nr:hypothetical protein [Bacillus cereus]
MLEEKPYKMVNPDLYISKRRQDNPDNYNIALEQKFFLQIKEGKKV